MLQQGRGCSSGLFENDEVLAPDKEHVLHLGILVDHDVDLPKSYRVVQFHEKAMALPEGRLVPWKGYARRVAEGMTDTAGARIVP
eukprot:symbB.v1.2.008947.t1/scaffold554.1/size187895/1